MSRQRASPLPAGSGSGPGGEQKSEAFLDCRFWSQTPVATLVTADKVDFFEEHWTRQPTLIPERGMHGPPYGCYSR